MRARNWTISSLHCANMSPSWPIIGALRHPPHWSTLATFFTHLPACSSACLRANLSAIADWCAATYVTPGDDHAVTIERIREYMKDALSTVAQQVSSSGQALAGCLEQQALELQSMDATMRLVENRLASQKEQLARSAMLGQFMRKLPVPRVNAGAIREPVKESSVYRNAEGRIDFSSLDSIGRGVPEGIQGAGVPTVPQPPPPPPAGGGGLPAPPPPLPPAAAYTPAAPPRPAAAAAAPTLPDQSGGYATDRVLVSGTI